MTILTLNLIFKDKLDCGKCDEVLLWLYDPTLLAINSGVTNPDILKHFIRTTISDIVCLKYPNSSSAFKYSFPYDDSLLEDSTEPLTDCDIKKVCCGGCFLKYIDEHQSCISTDEGNQIELGGDGCLFVAPGEGGGVACDEVPACETDLIANDSSSINFTTSGQSDHTLTAVVKVSSDPDNIISIHSDGIYAIASGSETPNAAIDTNSINLTLSSTLNRTIQADVRVSTFAGNLITVLGDGIYATYTEAANSSIDTNSIDITLTGSNNRTIQADVNISADAGNQLSIHADGLYVPPGGGGGINCEDVPGCETPLTANDSSSIDFTTSGTSGHTLTGDVKVSADGGNIISIHADGIYAAATSGFITGSIAVNQIAFATGTDTIGGSSKLTWNNGTSTLGLGDSGSLIGMFGVSPVGRSSAYTPSNVTPTRTYDANAVTIDTLADVVGTLIADFQALGPLG